MFSSCDQVQMKLTQLELNSSKLATNAECLGKRGREGEREREGGKGREKDKEEGGIMCILVGVE